MSVANLSGGTRLAGTTGLAGATWRKSTRSACDGACVEVALTPGLVGVRDSKDRRGGLLAFEPDTWSAFVTSVKRGEFDRR